MNAGRRSARRWVRTKLRTLAGSLASAATLSAVAAPAADPFKGVLEQFEAAQATLLPPGSKARERVREAALSLQSSIGERFAQRLRSAQLPKQQLEPEELLLRLQVWTLNQIALATANASARDKAAYFNALFGGVPTASGKSCVDEIAARMAGPLDEQRSLAVADFVGLTIKRVGLEARVLSPPTSDFGMMIGALALQTLARPDGEEPLPSVARRFITATGGTADARQTEEVDCEVHKWLMRRAMRDPARYRTELDALGYETAAGTHLALAQGLSADAGTESDEYPRVARVFGIEGSTELEVVLDSENRPESVTIARREVNVPGLLGEQPLAFERVFDTTAIRHANQRDYSSAGKTGKARTVRYQIDWTLPADAADHQ